jgi:hypothetical protein
MQTIKEMEKPKATGFNRYNDYCEAIKKNKAEIKVQVLEYVHKVLVMYYKELKDIVAFKPDITGLVKRYLIGTVNANVLKRILTMIEDLKQYDSAFEQNDMQQSKGGFFDKIKYISHL